MACNSILSALTPQDFKDEFIRGFNYLPVWSALTTYNLNEVVYYSTTRLFYRCLVNGTITSPPTDITKWAITGGTVSLYVSDEDITKSYREACAAFNDGLGYPDDETMILVYLYLAAHFLVNDFNAGGAKSVNTNPVNSRSVGNVSESYSVPDWALKNPVLSQYAKTSYGAKYLTLVYPFIVGNVRSVHGGTRA